MFGRSGSFPVSVFDGDLDRMCQSKTTDNEVSDEADVDVCFTSDSSFDDDATDSEEYLPVSEDSDDSTL